MRAVRGDNALGLFAVPRYEPNAAQARSEGKAFRPPAASESARCACGVNVTSTRRPKLLPTARPQLSSSMPEPLPPPRVIWTHLESCQLVVQAAASKTAEPMRQLQQNRTHG